MNGVPGAGGASGPIPRALFDEETQRRAGAIELLVLDVDGVLTDGSIFVDDLGRELKRFHVRDGFGIRCWRAAGLKAAVITGRISQAVAHRCWDLGIAPVTQGARDKAPAYRKLLAELKLPASAACVMGDDLPDLPMMRDCGLAATVADADPLVKRHAHWVAPVGGGQGAVRALIECLLDAQGRWEPMVAAMIAPANADNAA